MKKELLNNYLKAICLLQIILIQGTVFGQIGINTSNVNTNALLHISEKDDGNSITKKGIMIPRLTESERDELTYVDPLAATKVVKLLPSDNSLMIFNTTENCFNYWSSDDNAWKNLCGNLGTAEFGGIDCAELRINGTYIENRSVNGTHYMTISNVVVTKPGTYSITLEPDNDNGYFFKGEGTFNTVGNYNIRLYASGTPINEQTDTFRLDTSLTNDNTGCPVTVQVSKGFDGHNDGEFVSLPFLTYLSIAGSIHEGYSWGADYPARLESMRDPSNFGANGVVKSTGFKPFIVPSTLSANVPNIGYGNPELTKNLLAAELAKPASDPSRSLPDIIFYSAYSTRGTSTAIKDALIIQLVEYVNQGGVLVYCTDDNDTTHANSLVSGIFGSTYATASTGSSSDDIYPINNLPSDPIINGFFGNAAGEYWGEDNAGTVFIDTLPPNSVQIANSNGLNQGTTATKSVIWYSKDKNFFYFGDSVGTGNSTSNHDWPSHFIANTPMPKIYGGTKKREVYNSILEMNVMVWAGLRAKNNGINPHEE